MMLLTHQKRGNSRSRNMADDTGPLQAAYSLYRPIVGLISPIGQYC